MTLILRLRSVTSLTLARANQFNNKLWNTCENGAEGCTDGSTSITTERTAAGTGTVTRLSTVTPPSSQTTTKPQ
ncbi:MAG: hypothetical protein ABL940_11365 [Bacteroidia bacterium]